MNFRAEFACLKPQAEKFSQDFREDNYMSLLQRILKVFSGGSGMGGSMLYPVKVKCNRCGEFLTAKVNLANDLSVEYGSSGSPQSYSCRKIVQGSGRCFQTIEVVLHFDSHRTLKEKEIHGGTFVDE
jgi:hypothetical protein